MPESQKGKTPLQIWVSKVMEHPDLADWRRSALVRNNTWPSPAPEFCADGRILLIDEEWSNIASDYPGADGSETVRVIKIEDLKLSPVIELVNRRAVTFSVELGSGIETFSFECRQVVLPDLSDLKGLRAYVADMLNDPDSSEWYRRYGEALALCGDDGDAWSQVTVIDSEGGEYCFGGHLPAPTALCRGIKLTKTEWGHIIRVAALENDGWGEQVVAAASGKIHRLPGLLSELVNDAYTLGRRIREIEISRDYSLKVRKHSNSLTGASEGGRVRGLATRAQAEAVRKEIVAHFKDSFAGMTEPMNLDQVADYIRNNWPPSGIVGCNFIQKEPLAHDYLVTKVLPLLKKEGLVWPQAKAGRKKKSPTKAPLK